MTLIQRIEQADGPDKRILDRLDRSGECWLWTGALDASGRGRVWRNGKLTIHHRAVWEILVGPIPAGALLCHHCDNPTCGNPAHLYVGDSKTNVDDMVRRRRHWMHRDPKKSAEIGRVLGSSNTWARGAANPKAKLTPEQVKEVSQSREQTKILAGRYGVNRTTTQRIRSGDLWK